MNPLADLVEQVVAAGEVIGGRPFGDVRLDVDGAEGETARTLSRKHFDRRVHESRTSFRILRHRHSSKKRDLQPLQT